MLLCQGLLWKSASVWIISVFLMTCNVSTTVLWMSQSKHFTICKRRSPLYIFPLSSWDVSDLGSCPVKLSFQGLHPKTALMWGAHWGIRAWHLPNMLKTVSRSLCLSVSNWHTAKQTHAGGCLYSELPSLPSLEASWDEFELVPPLLQAVLCIHYSQYPALLHKV